MSPPFSRACVCIERFTLTFLLRKAKSRLLQIQQCFGVSLANQQPWLTIEDTYVARNVLCDNQLPFQRQHIVYNENNGCSVLLSIYILYFLY